TPIPTRSASEGLLWSSPSLTLRARARRPDQSAAAEAAKPEDSPLQSLKSSPRRAGRRKPPDSPSTPDQRHAHGAHAKRRSRQSGGLRPQLAYLRFPSPEADGMLSRRHPHPARSPDRRSRGGRPEGSARRAL